MSDDEFHSADEEVDALSTAEESGSSQVNFCEASATGTDETSSLNPAQSVSLNSSEAVATDGNNSEDEVEIEPAILHWESSPVGGTPPEDGLLVAGNEGLIDPPSIVATVADHWARPIASRPSNTTMVARQRVEPAAILQTQQQVKTANNTSDKSVEQHRSSSSPADRRGGLDEANDAIRLMQGCLGAPWPSHAEDSNDLPQSPTFSIEPPPPGAPLSAPTEPFQYATGPPPGGAVQSIGGVTREAVIARLNAAKAAKGVTNTQTGAIVKSARAGVEAEANFADKPSGSGAAAIHEASTLCLPSTSSSDAHATAAGALGGSSMSTVAPAAMPSLLPPRTAARKVALIRTITVPKYSECTDAEGFRYTSYKIKVVEASGKSWAVGKRYSEIADLHTALHLVSPAVRNFAFPNKSILNTFSSHTMERRRSGFDAFFQLLMDLMRGEVQETAVIAAGLAQLLDTSPAAFPRNCK